MAITYKKLLDKMEREGITSYTLKKAGLGGATWEKIKAGGHIDTRTIGALCALLDCQPGEILSFVPDAHKVEEDAEEASPSRENTAKAARIMRGLPLEEQRLACALLQAVAAHARSHTQKPE